MLPYFVQSQSIAATGTTFTYTSLTDARTGNVLPTFSETPHVDIQAVSDMGFYISTQDATSITIVPNGQGSASAPFTVHLKIYDLAQITGPTPGTDFSAQNEHLFCTPLDLRLESKLLTPRLVSDSSLMRYCSQASSFIRARLSRFYNDTTLRHDTAPWFRGFYQRSIWIDPEDESENISGSNAYDGVNRAGFFGLTVDTDFDTVFTQYYSLLFSSATAFTISGHIEGGVGSGNTSSQFTAGNGDFTLSASASFGTHVDKNVFYFIVYIWDPIIVDIATWLATGLALVNETGNSAKGISAMAKNKIDMARNMLMALNLPDDPVKGMRLKNLGARQLKLKSRPYDIDILGREISDLPTDNQDSFGNRGESDYTWSILGDLDCW